MRKFQNRQSRRPLRKVKRRKKTVFDSARIKKMIGRACNKRTAFLVFIAAIFATLVYCLFFSGYFALKNVTVSGNESIGAEKIESVIRAEISGKYYGYVPMDNCLLISGKSLSDKLTAAFPEIESVEISMRLPDRLSIQLAEKKPALIWCRGNCYFVNSSGEAILPASEGDLNGEDKHYIKIQEEDPILEEIYEESPDDTGNVEMPAETRSATDTDKADEPSQAAKTDTIPTSGISLPDIKMNERVADEGFIRFAIDINANMIQNTRLLIKYYKTKGYKTREIIAFTDKNIRIYFDTTQDAKRQTDNLYDSLEKGIEEGSVNGLKYIYLKNTDRVFYK